MKNEYVNASPCFIKSKIFYFLMHFSHSACEQSIYKKGATLSLSRLILF